MSEPGKLSFVVYGKPQSRGSKTSFPLVDKATGQPRRGKGGRIITVTKDSNPNSGEWMQAIALAARSAMREAGVVGMYYGPIAIRFLFIVSRPRGDFGTKGNLKARARPFPITRPDVLKYSRCAEDALSSVAYADDAQIVTETIEKRYGDIPGMYVELRELPASIEAFGAVPDMNRLDAMIPQREAAQEVADAA